MDDPTGIVVVETDEASGLFHCQLVGNQGKELPASRFNRGECLTRPLGQFLGGEMGMEGKGACHAAT